MKHDTFLTIEHPIERKIFVGLCAILGCLMCFYMYLVVASVMHVMARTEATTDSAQTRSEIGTLESTYLSLSQELNDEYAATLSLKPVSDVVYVYRSVEPATTVALNLH